MPKHRALDFSITSSYLILFGTLSVYMWHCVFFFTYTLCRKSIDLKIYKECLTLCTYIYILYLLYGFSREVGGYRGTKTKNKIIQQVSGNFQRCHIIFFKSDKGQKKQKMVLR